MKTFYQYPITAGMSALAIGVTLAWMSHWSVEPWTMGWGWEREPWRLLTTTLPHVSLYHLAFNVYWMWVFGTLLEGVLGPLWFGGIVVLLAAVSSAAEYAAFDGGVGLSGMGYGLFGMVWVLSRRDARFKEAIDTQTVVLFVAWFFICIVMTVQGIMPVGNVAHGAGAVVGAILGWIYVGRRRERGAAIAALVGAALVAGVGATVARPWVNFSDGGKGEAYAGYEALTNDANERAVQLLERAVKYRRVDAGTWYNLGIAYGREGRREEAVRCYREAYAQDPGNEEYRVAAEEGGKGEGPGEEIRMTE